MRQVAREVVLLDPPSEARIRPGAQPGPHWSARRRAAHWSRLVDLVDPLGEALDRPEPQGVVDRHHVRVGLRVPRHDPARLGHLPERSWRRLMTLASMPSRWPRWSRSTMVSHWKAGSTCELGHPHGAERHQATGLLMAHRRQQRGAPLVGHQLVLLTDPARIPRFRLPVQIAHRRVHRHLAHQLGVVVDQIVGSWPDPRHRLVACAVRPGLRLQGVQSCLVEGIEVQDAPIWSNARVAPTQVANVGPGAPSPLTSGSATSVSSRVRPSSSPARRGSRTASRPWPRRRCAGCTATSTRHFSVLSSSGNEARATATGVPSSAIR